MTEWRDGAQSRLTAFGAATQRTATRAMELLADACDQRVSVDARLRALHVTPGEPVLLARVARALAISDPATPEEIMDSLGVNLADLGAMLHSG